MTNPAPLSSAIDDECDEETLRIILDARNSEICVALRKLDEFRDYVRNLTGAQFPPKPNTSVMKRFTEFHDYVQQLSEPTLRLMIVGVAMDRSR